MLYLTHHAFCAQVDSQLVFLDLRGDRYHCLPPAESCAVAPLLFEHQTTSVPSRASAATEALSEAGLVTSNARHGRAASPSKPLVQTADLMGYPIGCEPEIGAAHLLRLVRATSTTALRLRLLSLEAIARRLRRRKKRARNSPTAFTPTALVEIFKRLRPLLFTAKDQCLYDSLVLLEFLSSYGLFPTWVIGVRMGPFSAHSWVQNDSVVYNDAVANVARFTPILTV